MLGSLQKVVFNDYLYPRGETSILKIQTRKTIITEKEEVNETWSTDGRIILRQKEEFIIHFNIKQCIIQK